MRYGFRFARHGFHIPVCRLPVGRQGRQAPRRRACLPPEGARFRACPSIAERGEGGTGSAIAERVYLSLFSIALAVISMLQL